MNQSQQNHQVDCMDFGSYQYTPTSDNFKTIVSESETRNPTTNKKKKNRSVYEYSSSLSEWPVQKSANQSRFLNSWTYRYEQLVAKMSIQELENQYHILLYKKQKNIEQRNYKKVKKIQMKKQLCLKHLNAKKLKLTEQFHLSQQNQLYQYHLQQMKAFKATWNKIFNNHRNRQRKLIQKVQKQQMTDIKNASQSFEAQIDQLNKKCHKKFNNYLKQSEKVQKGLLKLERYQLLANMNTAKQYHEKKNSLKQERAYLIENLKQKQQKKLQKKYDKRYKSLGIKIEAQKKCQQKIYRKNQQILRKKFIICLNKLKVKQKHQTEHYLKDSKINKSFY